MKRAFDLLVVLLFSPLWVAILFIVATVVGCKLGRPVFFRQRRPGKNGAIFELLKFRTMTDARDAGGKLLADADRLTSFGRRLRASSLDELPELVNVLRGDMSLVGPRPLLIEYLDRYTPEQSRRHEVLPGLTGWAQVNGRNAISWADKFKLDIWYVDHHTLWLDAKILWLTLKRVVQRAGISATGEATMPEFLGGSVDAAAVTAHATNQRHSTAANPSSTKPTR